MKQCYIDLHFINLNNNKIYLYSKNIKLIKIILIEKLGYFTCYCNILLDLLPHKKINHTCTWGMVGCVESINISLQG